MGDLLDILNYGAGRAGPDPEEAAKWHGAGHKVRNYGNPQGGVENPELYRRNYGLLLWSMDYDGGGPWAWQHSAFGGTWNDFNSNRRSVGMVYPTADGGIDTIAWEGFREGVDDVRYLTTLLDAIEKAKKSGDNGRRGKILAAEKYLGELKGADLLKRDLDTIRLELTRHILNLQRA